MDEILNKSSSNIHSLFNPFSLEEIVAKDVGIKSKRKLDSQIQELKKDRIQSTDNNFSNIRPEGYKYFDNLVQHLGGKSQVSRIFSSELVYPRQLEIHLPGNLEAACNFNCSFCQGKLLDKSLFPYEDKLVSLITRLDGKIPYFIFSGLFTEPTMDPKLMDLITYTKLHGSYFGLHTNGSLLSKLQEENFFLNSLCDISTSKEDYISASLDAGKIESHMKTKNIDINYFDSILYALEELVEIRGKNDFPSIRVTYLLNKINSSQKEIEGIIGTMKAIGVDSLRFSIPYDMYGKDFSKVRQYKEKVEKPLNNELGEMLKPMMSKDKSEKPFIFYVSPENQDIDKMNFCQCIYGYYQISIGADGYVYRCSSTAAPTFLGMRLGPVPDNISDFEKMLLSNQDPNFNPASCFKNEARCSRMAYEINMTWNEMNGMDTK